MEKKSIEGSILTTNFSKSKCWVMLSLFLILLSCDNLQSKYGNKVEIDNKLFLRQNIYNPDLDFKIVTLRITNNPYQVRNRNILVRIDTLILFRGPFVENKDIRIKFPTLYLNHYCSPNVLIYKTDDKHGYYFENKEGLKVDEKHNVINIEFKKTKDYLESVKFRSSIQ